MGHDMAALDRREADALDSAAADSRRGRQTPSRTWRSVATRGRNACGVAVAEFMRRLGWLLLLPLLPVLLVYVALGDWRDGDETEWCGSVAKEPCTRCRCPRHA